MRCHKCLERGHVRATCPSAADRSGRCYRCGEAGHTSRNCRSVPKCPLCADKGRPAAHVLGAKTCAQKNVRGGPPGRRTEQAPATGGAPPPAEERPTEGRREMTGDEPRGEPQPQRQPRTRAREEKASDEAMEIEAPSDGGDED
ncbi:PREDICTED: DNA-binding protein HEXBP-like [Vollenhovia emeryi]|uniref:DNA-binding protein HEXBP-like n=1 Tax=Vollenhovia emeryi TaxID=411798 RepID=UPI0005F4D514|nr:PREDICTED: DNA-binding protein HEXBP-like [Vollenhovia emeryi]